MKSEMHYLVLLAASPVLIFFVHMMTGRLYVKLNLRSSPLISAVWAILISVGALAFASWKFFLGPLGNPSEQAVAVIYGILVVACLGGSYYILFAMTEAARRIKILQEVYHHGTVAMDEINREYGADQLFSVRLERLLALRQLKKKDGRYYLQGKILYRVALLVSFWSRLLRFSQG